MRFYTKIAIKSCLEWDDCKMPEVFKLQQLILIDLCIPAIVHPVPFETYGTWRYIAWPAFTCVRDAGMIWKLVWHCDMYITM